MEGKKEEEFPVDHKTYKLASQKERQKMSGNWNPFPRPKSWDLVNRCCYFRRLKNGWFF
jgi:hypothetical protein